MLPQLMRNPAFRWLRAVGTQVAETYTIVANIIFAIELYQDEEDDNATLIKAVSTSLAATFIVLVISHLVFAKQILTPTFSCASIASRVNMKAIPTMFKTDGGVTAIYGASAYYYALLLLCIRLPGIILLFMLCFPKLVIALEEIEESYPSLARLDMVLLLVREIPMLTCEIVHLHGDGIVDAPIATKVALAASSLVMGVCVLRFLGMVHHEVGTADALLSPTSDAEIGQASPASEPLMKKLADGSYKVVVVGDSATGKTGICCRLAGRPFPDDLKTSVGVEFFQRQLSHDPPFKLNIWDTAGQERYRAVSGPLCRGAALGLLVYDVTNRVTFRAMENWIRDADKHSYPGLPKVLVANKIDLETEREVSSEEGRRFAAANNCTYCEVSAKKNEGIEALLRAIQFRLPLE